MNDYSQLCKHLHENQCVYIGRSFAIYEKCIYAKLEGEARIAQMRQDCPNRRTIRHLENGLLKKLQGA